MENRPDLKRKIESVVESHKILKTDNNSNLVELYSQLDFFLKENELLEKENSELQDNLSISRVFLI